MRADNEHSIQQKIQTSWSRLGHRLFRFNTGTAWVGKSLRPKSRVTVSVGPRDIVLFNCRPFHSGFVGAPDLWGWKKILVTPDMVGQTIAVFAVVEVKSATGKSTPEQQSFLDHVTRNGGIARLARNLEDSLRE